MKSRFLLIILTTLITLFIVTSINAISVSYGEWEDGSTSARIDKGENVSFNYYFNHDTSSMDISIDLFNSSGNLVYNFLDETVSENFYYNDVPVNITPEIYKKRGHYDLRFFSEDSDGTPSITSISLVVENTPPEIISSPVTEINKKENYSYQVEATDEDDDDLKYSLGESPEWILIDSNTGLVTGEAPEVDSDTSYIIELFVYDGIEYDTQKYTLIVKDVPDTIPPEVEIDKSKDKVEFGIEDVNIQWEARDNIKIDSTIFVIKRPDETILFNSSDYEGNEVFRSSNLTVLGNYNIELWSKDISGNEKSILDSFEVVDTTKPEINILNPKSKKYFSSMSDLNYTVSDNYELDSCWYNIGGENYTINCGENITGLDSKEGFNTWIVYAKDTLGNIAKESVRFEIDLFEEEDETDTEQESYPKEYTIEEIPHKNIGNEYYEGDLVKDGTGESDSFFESFFKGIVGIGGSIFDFFRNTLNKLFY